VSGDLGLKPNPIKELVGYKRLKGLAAKATRKTEIEIKVGSLAGVDEVGHTEL
jgi:beta-D-xylosidase 4